MSETNLRSTEIYDQQWLTWITQTEQRVYLLLDTIISFVEIEDGVQVKCVHGVNWRIDNVTIREFIQVIGTPL